MNITELPNELNHLITSKLVAFSGIPSAYFDSISVHKTMVKDTYLVMLKAMGKIIQFNFNFGGKEVAVSKV